MKKFKERMAERAGFTLVELIVVIAILGILTAVAVPAYTGYVEKAHEASDTQLLSAANTAFAAACVENGITNTDVTKADLNVSNKKITGITVETLAAGVTATANDIQDSFAVYFTGNTDTELGYYGSFTYADGNFTGVKADS